MSAFKAIVQDTDGDDVIVTVNGEDGTVEIESTLSEDGEQSYDTFSPATARRLSEVLRIAASVAQYGE